MKTCAQTEELFDNEMLFDGDDTLNITPRQALETKNAILNSNQGDPVDWGTMTLLADWMHGDKPLADVANRFGSIIEEQGRLVDDEVCENLVVIVEEMLAEKCSYPTKAGLVAGYDYLDGALCGNRYAFTPTVIDDKRVFTYDEVRDAAGMIIDVTTGTPLSDKLMGSVQPCGRYQTYSVTNRAEFEALLARHNRTDKRLYAPVVDAFENAYHLKLGTGWRPTEAGIVAAYDYFSDLENDASGIEDIDGKLYVEAYETDDDYEWGSTLGYHSKYVNAVRAHRQALRDLANRMSEGTAHSRTYFVETEDGIVCEITPVAYREVPEFSVLSAVNEWEKDPDATLWRAQSTCQRERLLKLGFDPQDVEEENLFDDWMVGLGPWLRLVPLNAPDDAEREGYYLNLLDVFDFDDANWIGQGAEAWFRPEYQSRRDNLKVAISQ